MLLFNMLKFSVFLSISSKLAISVVIVLYITTVVISDMNIIRKVTIEILYIGIAIGIREENAQNPFT